MCDTGKFTGRAPNDRYIVKDATTENTVWWGDINIPFEAKKFDTLYNKLVSQMRDKELYIRDAFAGADPDHRLSVRGIDAQAWHNLFCYNSLVLNDREPLAVLQLTAFW